MALRQWSMTADIPVFGCRSLDDFLSRSVGDTLPVGTVEALSELMLQRGIAVPVPDYYPESLSHHLVRPVWEGTGLDLQRRISRGETVFAKSQAYKALTGRVFAPGDDLEGIDPGMALWLADPVSIVSEHRFYVAAGEVVGHAQYGEYPDAVAPTTDALKMVREYERSGDAPAGYCLDLGRLDSGEVILIERNDAWALGYYKPAPVRGYVDCLWARWLELTGARQCAN
jgi:hypothetical protein